MTKTDFGSCHLTPSPLTFLSTKVYTQKIAKALCFLVRLWYCFCKFYLFLSTSKAVSAQKKRYRIGPNKKSSLSLGSIICGLLVAGKLVFSG